MIKSGTEAENRDQVLSIGLQWQTRKSEEDKFI
jgi:hypothetical protein